MAELSIEEKIALSNYRFQKSKETLSDAVRIFKHLLSLRTDVDYGDFEVITNQDAKDALKQAKRFIEIIEPVREQLIKELTIRLQKDSDAAKQVLRCVNMLYCLGRQVVVFTFIYSM